MPRVDELVQQLCPDGVEYKELCKVSTIIGGFAFKSTKYSERGIRVIRISDVQDGFISADSPVYYPTELISEYEKVLLNSDDLLMSLTGNIGRVALLSKELLPAALNQRVACIRANDSVLQKYLFYFLNGSVFQTQAIDAGKGSAQANLSMKWLAAYPIPVPSLEVQQEIVRVLDAFTELEANLQRELDARKRQCAHYRDELLTFDESVSRRKMVDICSNVCSGGTPSSKNKEYYNGDIPWLRTQEVDFCEIYETGMTISQKGLSNSAAKWIPENCLIIAMYGATAAKAAINRVPLTTNQACCNLEIDSSIAVVEYVYHWICKHYRDLKAKGQGSQNNINAKVIKDYPIIVPPLETQRTIVAKVNAMVALQDNLQRQIDLTHRQYEHYRDRLLDLPKKVA